MNPSGFSVLNYVILGVYLLAMVGIGVAFSRRQKSAEDYFLAGRRLPWLAVAMSMYASLTSAVTYMGLPGLAYRSNITLIVVCAVSPLLAPFLIFLFYPFYRRLKVSTSYEYIGLRFGRPAQRAVSSLFLLARIGWLGTVIYAPALALSVSTQMPLGLAILLMGGLATVYTVLGGLSAVVWTDVIQFVILVGGVVWMLAVVLARVPGGAGEILSMASAADHIQLDFSVSLFRMTAVVVAVSFFLQMMQDYGTDQVTVQRLLAVKTYRGMIKAVLFNAVTDLLLVASLLFIGLGLLAFYTLHPGELAGGLSGDRVLPHFIMTQLPNGISGLLITAIFAAAMSSMDSGINSMATVILYDFVRPLRRTPLSATAEVRLARWLTLGLGIFATGVAFYVSTLVGIVEAFATFMGLFSAPVLVLFLLGMLSRRARFEGWCLGTLLSVGVTYGLQRYTPINWTWYFPLSFCVSMAGSLVFSWIPWRGRERACPAELTLAGRGRHEPACGATI